MTGRTHDLAAFTALNFIVATQPLSDISLSTALVALSANLIGGLAPDIDQPTADLWRRLPGGSVVGRIITPVLGGHRFISHSILGILVFGFVTRWFLEAASQVVLVDMNLVWMAFMIGFISHLVMDTLTKEGVPWLFPIPINFGFPPLRILRIKTSGLVEKSMIFPGLMILNGFIFYNHYGKYLELLRHYIK
jgi:inner membrane protein